jgi:hypothetical protein
VALKKAAPAEPKPVTEEPEKPKFVLKKSTPVEPKDPGSPVPEQPKFGLKKATPAEPKGIVIYFVGDYSIDCSIDCTVFSIEIVYRPDTNLFLHAYFVRRTNGSYTSRTA